MALPTKVNIGTAPGNGTGDPARTAFDKLNVRDEYLDANKLDRGNFEGTADDLKALVTGKKWKDVAILATTGNITLSGEQVIDGIQTDSTRVLVKNQNNFTENGIYTTSSGAWIRTEDADSGIELENATLIVVEGVENTGHEYTCTSKDIVLGTTAIIFNHTNNHEVGTAESPESIKAKYESNEDTNAFTDEEKNKLDGISPNANNYTHPSTHPASIIVETSGKRFVSDAEKAAWNAKQNALGYTPANDSEVVKTVNGIEPNEEGNVTVEVDSDSIPNSSLNDYENITSEELVDLNELIFNYYQTVLDDGGQIEGYLGAGDFVDGSSNYGHLIRNIEIVDGKIVHVELDFLKVGEIPPIPTSRIIGYNRWETAEW